MNAPPAVALSVVVCTYNRADLLRHALESLAGQDLPSELLEVVVVDNNSSDGTRQVAQSFAGRFRHWQLLAEPRQGLSHARNCGWQAARGRWVAFLDDDAQAASDWAGRIVRAFSEVRPEPASVGGPILPWYDCKPPGWFSDAFETRSWGDAAGFLPEPGARFGFSGSNMAFPRAMLEQHGGFDAGYGMVGGTLRLGEETELYLRLHAESPLFWYDPQLTVRHYVAERNFRLGWRLRRRFRSGRTRAALEQRRIFSRDYLAELRNLGLLLVRCLRLIGAAPGSRRVLLAEGLQKISYQLGYLFG